jgi:NADH-quinone oxidoreductase subunit E
MLSDVTKMAIRAEVARVPHKKTALLVALKLAQKEQGWLSRETLAEVADVVDLPHSHAVELATFYAMLFTSPVAQVRVETCVQLPCALAGAELMARKLAKALDVTMEGPTHRAHGHTSDHKIELHTTVECYGSCHRAPMCRVGDEYRENIRSDDDVKKLAAELRARAS